MKHRLCSVSAAFPWLPLGIGLGTALGVALDQLAVGLAIGVAFGLVMRGRAARNP